MRSGASRSAPHTRHQVWMSASVSACLADSMRLVFASCQPAASGQRPGGQARVQPDLAQALRKLLPCSLDA